jgi:hypothetical protein
LNGDKFLNFLKTIELLRPFHFMQHGRVVMIGVVFMWTALVVSFGTDLPVVVDDNFPMAYLSLPARKGSTPVNLLYSI